MKIKISRAMFSKFVKHIPQLPQYNPNADFDWVISNSFLPWLQLDIDVPVEEIQKELDNIRGLMIPHRDDYSEHFGWSSFCIHGKSFDATREDEYYNDQRPYVWTPEAVKLMPATVKYFQSKWPQATFKRLRVMLLEPNGYVTIHRDYDSRYLCPINIAITQPDGCNFVMEKQGTVPFSPGSAFMLDISNNHVVFNDSTESRWHIIVHQSFDNIEFQNLVVKSYHNMYNSINENSNNRH